MLICYKFLKVLFYRVMREVPLTGEGFLSCRTDMSYGDTFVLFITASIRCCISAGAWITNLHARAKLLTLMLDVLLSF